MRKKIMLLIAIIPIIFLLTIYSVTKVTGVYIDVPVSGIAITSQNEDGIISLDLANYNNDLYISANVLPSAAQNRGYSYQIENLNGNQGDIEIDQKTGKIIATTVGKYKITVKSNESAYTDSIILDIGSSKPVNITPTLKNNAGTPLAIEKSTDENYDYTATINSGVYNLSALISPNNLSQYSANWTSDNNNKITINPITGKFIAMLSGKTFVTATINDGAKGKIEKKILFTINKPTGITVNGLSSGCVVNADNNLKNISFFVETDGDTPTLVGSDISSYTINDLGDNQYIVNVVVKDNHAIDCPVSVSANGYTNNITISFAPFNFNVYTSYHLSGDNTMYHKNGTTVNYVCDSLLYDENITYSWQCDNPNILSIVPKDSKNIGCQITAKNLGQTSLTISAIKDNSVIYKVVKDITVVAPISSITFLDGAKTYGIENIKTLANQSINGTSYKTENPILDIQYKTPDGKTSPFSMDFYNITDFSSSNKNIAQIASTFNDFKLKINSTGLVQVNACWKYNNYFGENVEDTISVRVVKDGVNVKNYNELKKATSDKKPVVLSQDIMIGKANMSVDELKAYAQYTPTTYDWTFYKNIDGKRPNVMYLVEFTNNVYGNGFEINADYITKAKDSTGTPKLFKGPLDFVSIAAASVKAQDNIVFLAKTPNITINNIVLKGCNDESLKDDDGNFNLSELNYTGTTLEIADSVQIKNSRVRNGRTTVRVFGGKTNKDGSPIVKNTSEVIAENERINVKIESCILSNAREFILKIGSNRAILTTTTGNNFNPPKLLNKAGNPYDIYDDTKKQDGYFYDHYVMTDVTLKNSVLATSGLFSVGMETHFSGPMLNSEGFTIQNWTNLSCTSYPSALHLEGNTKLLDWKKLENIDSSTLIEVSTSGQADNKYNFLQMNISEMLNKVFNVKPDCKNIISLIDGKKYVHGGIAFYGGGNNYSYIDMSNMTNEMFNYYQINISILKVNEPEDSVLYTQGNMLPLAAGDCDFRFYMYGNNSSNNYTSQQESLNNGSAYDVPVAM